MDAESKEVAREMVQDAVSTTTGAQCKTSMDSLQIKVSDKVLNKLSLVPRVWTTRKSMTWRI